MVTEGEFHCVKGTDTAPWMTEQWAGEGGPQNMK